MRFVICGTMLPPEVEDILPGASPATGKFIRNMENAMIKCGYDFIEHSYVAIPGAEEAFDALNIQKGNIVFKNKTIIKSVMDYQKQVIDSLQTGDVIVFYDVVYFHIGLVDKLKKAGHKVFLILSDFSESYEENGNIIRWLLSRLIKREFKKFKYGMILSDKTGRYFNTKAKIITIEGGTDNNLYKDFDYKKEDSKIRVMYAGSFTRVQGVDIFLEAISLIPNDSPYSFEFYISGKGDLSEKVEVTSEQDSRIKYLGYMSDSEYYSKIRDMDVFVNPRNMSFPQNQNNFPSKVLEYLSTGKSVISTRFPGYEKFDDNFIFYDGTVESLAKELVEAAKMVSDDTYRRQIFMTNREKAKCYDWINQVKKISALVND